MCELFNMAACGGADRVLISTEGMEVVVAGGARRDTLPANDNDNRQVTTRHLATSIHQ